MNTIRIDILTDEQLDIIMSLDVDAMKAEVVVLEDIFFTLCKEVANTPKFQGKASVREHRDLVEAKLEAFENAIDALA